MLWDYARPGGEARKFVLLQPNQRCSSLFFSYDGQLLLGIWLSQLGQPTITAWRVSDGTRLAEYPLSDHSGSPPAWADFHSGSSHLLLVHGGPVAAVSVIFWDGQMLRPRPLTHGHLGCPGGPGDIVSARLLDEGNNFAIAEATAVSFWTFLEAPSPPRQVLRVVLGKQLRGFETLGRIALLLPDQGKLQLMNFHGQPEQASTAPLPNTHFTALAARRAAVCVGCSDGSLLLLSAENLQQKQRIPAPADLGVDQHSPAVSSTSFGMNEDYACVCFADGSHGVAHFPSGGYVALRAGHGGSISGLAMAPELGLPPAMIGRLVEPDQLVAAKALHFLSLSGGSGSFVAWPRRGPPSRSLQRLPAQVTAAAFHPAACLSNDGRMAGAYALLLGAEDGSLYVLESEDRSEPQDPRARLSWRVARVGPAPDLATLEARTLPQGAGTVTTWSSPPRPGFTEPAGACSHLAFSRCGNFVLVSHTNGAAEMLRWPLLTSALILQGHQDSRGAGPVSNAQPKAQFVWRPTSSDREYDRNLYVAHQSHSPWEVLMHEVYILGESYAKQPRAMYSLPAVCQAAGGSITDFCAHPSQLYLLMAAVLPSAATQSIVLVFDLWTGELLKSCAVFTSLLISPTLPLRPSLTCDASGSFLICSSSPTKVGPLDHQLLPGGAGGFAQGLSDLFQVPAGQPIPPAQSASIVCIIDFRTGLPCYQTSMEASCLSMGSVGHDPTQLLVGAADGSLTVWQLPEAVSARVAALLEECRREVLIPRAGSFAVSGSKELEEAVAALWAKTEFLKVDWRTWGDGGQPHPLPSRPLQLPALPVLHGRPMEFGGAREEEEDVVVQARKSWALSPPPTQPFQRALGGPGLAPFPSPDAGRPTPQLLLESAQAPLPGIETDPVSGLSVEEVPGRTPNDVWQHFRSPGSLLQADPWGCQREQEPAELLVQAPEFREVFGSHPEHFEESAPSGLKGGGLPRWMERGRPPEVSLNGRAAVKSVLTEIDRFESSHPEAKVLDSPRSEVAVGQEPDPG